VVENKRKRKPLFPFLGFWLLALAMEKKEGEGESADGRSQGKCAIFLPPLILNWPPPPSGDSIIIQKANTRARAKRGILLSGLREGQKMNQNQEKCS
jgi:hypothetical protein